MADRFPSLEDFDSGRTEAKGDAGYDLVGDAADTTDFLSRERALLGEDANQFATPQDNAPTAQDDDDDLLGGGGGHFQTSGPDEEIGEFESSFPAIDTSNERMAPGGTITGSSAPFLSGQPDSSSFAPSTTAHADEEEPQVVREWRERRALAIAHRDEISAQRKAETVKAAQSDIDEFYDNYNNKKEKMVAQTRREAEGFLQSREDTTAGGTSWERIAKLVDLSGKGIKGGAGGTGRERFRELLLSLRKDEKAPGATGY